MGTIAGIDLGTTFSELALLNEMGRPEIVPTEGGERLLPSALYFPEDEPDKVLVGREALNSRRINLKRCARWIKRTMGDAEYPQLLNGRKWKPEELSALILRKLKEGCAYHAGEIREALISVPAHFDEVRRKATMAAGILAGLDVIGLVNEPTAAALFYAVTREVSGRILVFDLGGGTFDVTVMDVAGRDAQVVCSQGDHQLGGYDFDQLLIEDFRRAYRERFDKDLCSTKEALKEDRVDYEDKAEDAKKTLSARPRAGIPLNGPAGSMNYEIKREAFEAMVSPLMSRIEMLVEVALDEAKHGPEGIKQVLLVGGSTRIPMVRRRLEKIFGYPPTVSVNVDECVACGAALCAGLRLVDERPQQVGAGVAAGLRDVKMTDVCNSSYGTLCLGLDDHTCRPRDENDIIISKNTPLPCEFTKTYYTVHDGQRAVDCTVTQGEGPDPEYVQTVARGRLDLPPNRPAHRPILVTYRYDKDQRMHCLFKDGESGRWTEMHIDARTAQMSTSDSGRPNATLAPFEVE